MVNKLNKSLQKERKRVKMRSRLAGMILLIIVSLLLTYSAVLVFGGEFGDLRKSAYNALVEKTTNSSTYLQNNLQDKSVLVLPYADQMQSVLSDLLESSGGAASDLQTDEALGDSLIMASAGIVSDLLRYAEADEAYLILDTGELYIQESGEPAVAALYLQAGENGDILMALGPDDAAQNYGFTMSADWAAHFAADAENNAGFEVYSKILETARDSSGAQMGDLGYWSGYSKVTADAVPTVKYSIPLIAEDGTVYGVLGIGLSEDTLLSMFLPAVSTDESVCYVLGYGDKNGSYRILARSGDLGGALLGDASSLRVARFEGDDIYRFEMLTDVDLLGCVQYMELFDGSSPYTDAQWALISVADRSVVMHPVLTLQKMMLIACAMALLVAVVIAIPGCVSIIRPVSNLTGMIKSKRKYNEVIRFQPSNVYEVDEIADAVTQLQINVLDFSSQVSRMISVAGVGIGTFLYDRTDDSVFVGQSLIQVMQIDLPLGEDIVMSRQEFLSSIKNSEVRALIASGLEKADGTPRGDSNEVYQIKRLNGEVFWMRLNYTYSPTSAIGIVQDVTDTMEEKNRIEHERDYDALTGLLTRHAYYKRIEGLFRDKSKLKITAFVMIDLDNLKYVNDTYGHDYGDAYIKTAANVFKRFEEYGGTVARLSGDEFNICLPGFTSKEEIRRIINRIHNELLRSSCLLADGTHFGVSGSVGISWYPDDADSREVLMKYADFAMYMVKHSTKGDVAEFDLNAYLMNSARLTDIEELNRVIRESRVQYAFQSIVSVKTGEIYGYEALMRVKSDIFKSPLELLSTAKTSGKYHEVERLTWTKSLADFQALLEEGKVDQNAHLFVNSIASYTLDAEVIREIESTYPHLLNRIVMEILESESMDETSTAHKENIMHSWGAQVALDDYGTGYNSEYALLSLLPRIIKIDQSIVSGCDRDNDRRMIIENLVKLARAKDIRVLAEGVETEEEMETVISCGVDFLQGFYLARPVFEPKPISVELTERIRALSESAAAREGENASSDKTVHSI